MKTKAWSPHWSCFQHCCTCLLFCCWAGLRSAGRLLPEVEQGRETWFAAGFGICSVPWAEQFPPQTKLHFPGVRISAEVKFDVFNWYHHVRWWKIASIRGAQQGRSEQQGFLGYFNRENGSRHKWRCWGLVGCGTVSADAVFGCRSRALKKMKHLGVEKEEIQKIKSKTDLKWVPKMVQMVFACSVCFLMQMLFRFWLCAWSRGWGRGSWHIWHHQDLSVNKGVCSCGPGGFSFWAVFQNVQVKDGMFVSQMHSATSQDGGNECVTHRHSGSEGRGSGFCC